MSKKNQHIKFGQRVASFVQFCVSVGLHVCVSFALWLSAGSQQTQDQTNRRSGNTGEKHNENGVRYYFC